MQTFVFAHNRYDSMTTSLMCEADGVEHHVIVSSPKRAELFARHGRVAPERLIPTGLPDGLAYSRNAALEMMEEGEWALFLVDDMKQCYELDDYDEETRPELPITFDNQNLYREKFRKPISVAKLIERGQQAIPRLEKMGAKLLGWAGFENPMFRRKKWGYNILADGRAWLVKKTDLRFDMNAQIIDDLCFTAQNIQEFGVVVVDRWILPDFKRYSAGGLGVLSERMEAKMKEAAYLVEAYPDLITYKKKAGWPEGSHVALRPGLHKKFPVKEIEDA